MYELFFSFSLCSMNILYHKILVKFTLSSWKEYLALFDLNIYIYIWKGKNVNIREIINSETAGAYYNITASSLLHTHTFPQRLFI